MTQTKAAGEIKTLDPAHHGPLTIDRSITITGVPGTSIRMVDAGNAIAINAANAIVNLCGIEIDGQGLGTVGVAAYYARVLNIVDCIVRRFTNEGVAISGGWDGMSVTIADTISSSNGREQRQRPSGGRRLPEDDDDALGRSVATGNQAGVQNVNFATVESFGDNEVIGNETNVSGTIASISHK